MNHRQRLWHEVEGAVEVTALAALECALAMSVVAALSFLHGGL